MRRIGHPPTIRGRAIPALVLLAAILGGSTAQSLGWSGAAWWGAVLGWGVAVVVATLLYFRWRYRPLHVDFATGTAMLGKTQVPVSQVVGATRLLSVGVGAHYLEYRFEDAAGAWARVLVTGRPLRGLDAHGRDDLRRFIEASSIEGPTPTGERSVSQEVMLEALGGPSWRATPVDEQLLLSELAHLDAADAGPEAPPVSGRAPVDTGRGTGTPDEELLRQWAEDEAAAEVWLREHPVPGARARRLLGWLTALLVAAFGAVVGLAALTEQQSTSGRLDDDRQDLAVQLLGITLLGAGIAYVGYTIARARHQRGLQAMARSWAGDRGPEQVERGLPPQLLQPFFERPPGHQLRSLFGYVLATFGVLCGLSGPIAWSTGDLGSGPAVLVTAIGVALIAGSIAVFVRSRRRARGQLAEAVHLAGARLHFAAS